MHYSLHEIRSIETLKGIFPDGEANEMNFCLFSTSGVHGSYVTIEQLEESIKKYGEEALDEESTDLPDDYYENELTVLVCHPRLVCLKYGNIKVSLSDIPYLKKLRQSSLKAVQKIGV